MPGSKYAWGRVAWGLCNRCGLRFLLKDLVFDGYMPGLRVCADCYDPKHPQEFLIDVTDPEALWKPSPDTVAFTAPVLTLVSLSAGAVSLAWSIADFQAYTVGSYAVYRATGTAPAVLLVGPFNNVEDILQDGGPPIIDTLAYVDSAVVVGATYTYKVIATALGPETVTSNPITVVIP